MQVPPTDGQSLSSAIPIIAASIGLLAAVISFVNGRLNEAKTRAKKNRVLATLFVVVDACIMLGGYMTLNVKTPIGVSSSLGLNLLMLSFFLGCVKFMIGSAETIRADIVEFVVRTSLIFTVSLLVVLSQMSEIQASQLEIIRVLSERLR